MRQTTSVGKRLPTITGAGFSRDCRMDRATSCRIFFTPVPGSKTDHHGQAPELFQDFRLPELQGQKSRDTRDPPKCCARPGDHAEGSFGEKGCPSDSALRRRTPHDMRHTYATLRLGKGELRTLFVLCSLQFI